MTATVLDRVDSFRTYDPEDLAEVFGQSLVARARKRTVIQPGSFPFNQWLVVGDSKLGDAYDDYLIVWDGRRYRCSCSQHAGGEFRTRICSHALAVRMKVGARPKVQAQVEGSGSGSQASEAGAPAAPGPVDGAAAVDGCLGGQAGVGGGGGVEEGAVHTDPTPALSDPRDEGWGQPAFPEWVTAFRPHQITATEEIVDAFERGDFLVVVDAPTGSGKSLLAEMVRRRLDVRALYVCSTKSLQSQFLNDYPYARLLKGRSNYPTATRPFPDWSAADCTKVRGDDESCAWCPSVKACGYEMAKRDALSAPIAVVNTAYFLAEANGPGRFSGWDLVIVDEADLLESELMGTVEVRVSKAMQRRLGIDVPDRKTVEEAWGKWVVDEAVPKVEAGIHKLPKRSEDVKKIRERIRLVRLLDKLELLAGELGEGRWVPTEDWERTGNVVFRPVRVDHLGWQWLWRHGQRWLAMSATVIETREMVESLGLEKVPSEGVAA